MSEELWERAVKDYRDAQKATAKAAEKMKQARDYLSFCQDAERRSWVLMRDALWTRNTGKGAEFLAERLEERVR
jgi:hypothetical protein